MSMLINPYAYGGTAPPPDDPSTIASVWEWWEPEREGLANNDPIGTLTGQVAPGSGHNWVQSNASFKPTFKTNQINGLGCMNFPTGTAHYLQDVNPSALTAAHLFIIVRIPTDPLSGTPVPWKFGTSASTDHYVNASGSAIECGAFSTTRRNCGDPTPDLTQWRVLEVVSTSSEWTCRLDGTQLLTTGTNTVAAPVSCVVGANTGGGSFWRGDIAGIYIFSAKLTTDRATMVTYLNDRFGLSIT